MYKKHTTLYLVLRFLLIKLKSEFKTIYIQFIDPNGDLLKSSSTPDSSVFIMKDSIVEFTISRH